MHRFIVADLGNRTTLIAQQDHPMLATLTMTNEIIAIDDWVLPQGRSNAANSRAECLERARPGGSTRRIDQASAGLLMQYGVAPARRVPGRSSPR
jgi:hypothetical protein